MRHSFAQKRLSVLAAAALAALSLTLMPQAALAHDEISSTSPEAETTVEAGKIPIVLTFSEAVMQNAENAGIEVSVTGPQQGEATERTDGCIDSVEGNVITESADIELPGTYVVNWRSVSEDGHPIDGTFNFTVENTRVGQDVDREKLILEVETDGTITPEAAVRKASAILVGQFAAFSGLGEAPAPAPAPAGGNLLDMAIEDLDLPMRAYNALKRAQILKVGQILAMINKDEMELLKLRNFGQKSLTEVRAKLEEKGFDLPASTIPADLELEDDEDGDEGQA